MSCFLGHGLICVPCQVLINFYRFQSLVEIAVVVSVSTLALLLGTARPLFCVYIYMSSGLSLTIQTGEHVHIDNFRDINKLSGDVANNIDANF